MKQADDFFGLIFGLDTALAPSVDITKTACDSILKQETFIEPYLILKQDGKVRWNML